MDNSSSGDPKPEPKISSKLLSSASVQTRLLNASSQSRHRVLGQLPPIQPIPVDETSSHTSKVSVDIPAAQEEATSLGGYLDPWNILLGCSGDAATFRQRLAHYLRLRSIFLVYCCFCLAFSSSVLFSIWPTVLGVTGHFDRSERDPDFSISPLRALPLEQLLSKATSIQNYRALRPYVMRASLVEDGITACLWTDLEHISSLSAWTTRWKGYISLVVTTRVASLNHTLILDQFHALPHARARNLTTSVHVLHLEPDAPDNPNAFLNLARLFAHTSTVALFPGNLSAVPPKTFARSLSSKRLPSKPVIYSMRGQTAYPFSSLSPLILERDDPLWCTERFFPYASRSTDWVDCMWQAWLENFGDVEVRLTTDWVNGVYSDSKAVSSSSQSKVRRRLGAKFRGETCILATRQLAALRAPDRGVDARKARWLKRNCREWTNS